MIRLREVHCKGCGKFVSDKLQRQYCYKCRPRVRDPWRKAG